MRMHIYGCTQCIKRILRGKRSAEANSNESNQVHHPTPFGWSETRRRGGGNRGKSCVLLAMRNMKDKSTKQVQLTLLRSRYLPPVMPVLR